ncbi:hypothetical protein [Gymnodinialimonas ceratoperidinii]|uniref:Uncharacterized protein n=1 Tax=Gymnodinialimonas ceratoperidinii TaxID=2856823 RepID=A0A8F6Y9S6_9RHOB|nr:hypothetical protein [Gymnodinialimonas ceratoperidinii]QXT39249.1 hypothetical protein KYE46_15180 [Gymnodinialimonas ceratoperidinii]
MFFAFLARVAAVIMLIASLYGILSGIAFIIGQDTEVQYLNGVPFAETPQFMKDSYRLMFWSLVLGTLSEIAIALRRRSQAEHT